MVINIPTFYYELGSYNLTNLPIKSSSFVGSVQGLRYCVYAGGNCVPSGHSFDSNISVFSQGLPIFRNY